MVAAACCTRVLRQGVEGGGAGGLVSSVRAGVLYYLTLEANAQLLGSCAAASPAGSRLLATMIPAENLAANRAAPASHALSGLFTVCVDDVVGSGALAAAGWADAAVSADLADVVRERYDGALLYYPYGADYANGARLASIEQVVEARRA